jgi:hypothetical protein
VTEDLELTSESVANLKFCEACVYEALRLGVSPFGSIFRKALTDIDFGEGDVIPQGAFAFHTFCLWLVWFGLVLE